MTVQNVAFGDQLEYFFSDGTDPELVGLLNKANACEDKYEKEAVLREAVETFPKALDATIALYKFYFRTARFEEAEKQVWATMKEAALQGGFSWKYNMLTQRSANWLDDHNVSRLYLFSLKALGVIRLRRGKVVGAKNVLEKLLELDPHDELGGRNFLDIANSFLKEG